MRLAKHVKIITSHIENLQDLKSQLETVLDDINNIVTKGQNWIDEKEATATCSFIEINQLFINETSKCIQKCLNIAHENEDASTVTSSHDGNASDLTCKFILPNTGVNNLKDVSKYNDIKMKQDEIDKWMDKQSTAIKKLRTKLKHQEKQNGADTDKDRQIELQFEEIMKELHSASDFMSNLQLQNEKLTDENKKHDTKLETLINKVEKFEEKLTAITDNEETRLNADVQSMKKDIAAVSSDLVAFKTSSDQNLADYKKNNDVFQKQLDIKLATFLFKVPGKQINYGDLLNLTSGRNIAFSVGLTTTTEVLKDNVVKYNEIYTNSNDCYSISTGIFNCPLAGHYVFHVGVIATGNRSVGLNLFLNSDYKISVYAYAINIYGTGGNTVILHLNQRDKVYLKTERDSELLGNQFGIFNTFSGFLIYAD